MRIISWNVNGIRAIAKKGFLEWFEKTKADIVCLQETKAFRDQLKPDLQTPSGYESVWHSGERAGYAGVVTYTKKQPLNTRTVFEENVMFSEEGRVVETEFEDFVLLNIYFPNGGTLASGEERLSYKLEFYKRLLKYINKLRKAGKSIIVCGDFNICHTEIDIARPKENANSIGFLPVERAEIDKIVKAGYVDIFRELHPDETDAYTWWSYRMKARERNVGWRLDYFMISPDLVKRVKRCEHLGDVMGSDHCPVLLELK